MKTLEDLVVITSFITKITKRFKLRSEVYESLRQRSIGVTQTIVKRLAGVRVSSEYEYSRSAEATQELFVYVIGHSARITITHIVTLRGKQKSSLNL